VSWKIPCLIGYLVFVVAARGADPLEKPILAPETAGPAKPKQVHVILAKDDKQKPTDKFTSDMPKIRAFWNGSGLTAGDRIGVVWVAKDVGIDAPHDSKISQGIVTAYRPDDIGIFALAQPKGGWPLGKYRCELYLNGKLIESLDFTIEQGATVQLQ
jgi:hypothetical protein